MSAEDIALCIVAGIIGALSGALVGLVFVGGGLLLARIPVFTRMWNALVRAMENYWAWLSVFLRGARR